MRTRIAVVATILIGLAVASFAFVPAGEADAAAASPNFVVIITDDQRWDTIGRCTPALDGADLAAGTAACMPNLQADLVASGITFLNGQVTQALCCPTRASILTGQYSTTTGVTSNDGSRFKDASTVATWLQGAGYRTGMFGKYLNGYGIKSLANYIPPGWDSFHALHGTTNQDNIYTNYPWIDWDAGGPAPVVGRFLDANSTSEAACAAGNYYSTDRICNLSLQFLARDKTKPFLLYIGAPAPQSPNTPADRHAGQFSTVTLPKYPDYNAVPSPNPPSYLPASPLSTRVLDRATKYVRGMLASTLAVDDMIGQLHDTLEADGRLANTVWVFMSDNGYAAGEHRLQTRSCAYVICHRVPFIVVCPPTVCSGAKPGAVDSTHHALSIDIAPTIAELAGLTPGLAVEGRSLAPIIKNPSAPWRTEWYLHDTAPSLDGVVAQIGTATYKYVARATGEKELYNLTTDPYELSNLAGNASFTWIQNDLAARLTAHLAG